VVVDRRAATLDRRPDLRLRGRGLGRGPRSPREGALRPGNACARPRRARRAGLASLRQGDGGAARRRRCARGRHDSGRARELDRVEGARVREDLLALTPEKVTALSNAGLVKRALRELEAGQGPRLEEDAKGVVRGTFPDGVVATLPPGVLLR